jgi:CheY-like chemotaxis protein
MSRTRRTVGCGMRTNGRQSTRRWRRGTWLPAGSVLDCSPTWYCSATGSRSCTRPARRSAMSSARACPGSPGPTASRCSWTTSATRPSSTGPSPPSGPGSGAPGRPVDQRGTGMGLVICRRSSRSWAAASASRATADPTSGASGPRPWTPAGQPRNGGRGRHRRGRGRRRAGVERLARSRYEPPGPPQLVLLDLKMPRMDGLEVLRLGRAGSCASRPTAAASAPRSSSWPTTGPVQGLTRRPGRFHRVAGRSGRRRCARHRRGRRPVRQRPGRLERRAAQGENDCRAAATRCGSRVRC